MERRDNGLCRACNVLIFFPRAFAAITKLEENGGKKNYEKNTRVRRTMPAAPPRDSEGRRFVLLFGAIVSREEKKKRKTMTAVFFWVLKQRAPASSAIVGDPREI